MIEILKLKDVSIANVSTYVGKNEAVREYIFNNYILGYRRNDKFIDIFTKEVYDIHNKHHVPSANLDPNKKYVYSYFDLFATSIYKDLPATTSLIREVIAKVDLPFNEEVYNGKVKVLIRKQ